MCGTSAGRSGLSGKEIVSWPQLATKFWLYISSIVKNCCFWQRKMPQTFHRLSRLSVLDHSVGFSNCVWGVVARTHAHHIHGRTCSGQ